MTPGTRPRSPSRQQHEGGQAIAQLPYRYVELYFFLPDQIEQQFRAFVVKADTPRAALLEAKRNTLKAHPGATEMREFMQIKISDDRAEEIASLIRDKQWSGWPEDEETRK